MRTVLRYENGRAVWSENTPAYAGSIPLRGSLVVAPSRPAKGAGLTANQANLDDRPVRNGRPPVYATDEERLAARRATYRASKQRAARERAA